MKNKVVFILGPTGSGKTALAVSLAKKFDGEIISADSRQVYIGLDVGTGKDLDEYGSVKYHLIDVAMPEENFTLFDWLDQAKVAVSNILKRGKLPIVVGGTGLYAKALAEGYCLQNSKFLISNFKSSSNTKFQRKELDTMSLEQLQEIFSKLKIDTEKLDLHNPRRLIRSIEKAQEGIETVKVKPDFDSLILAIDLDREEIYRRIDKRVDIRFKQQGMLEEIMGLLGSGVSKDWLSSLGLEYKIISEFLLSHPELIYPERSRRISGFQTKIPKQVRDDVSTSVRDDVSTLVRDDNSFEEMSQRLKWKTHTYARRQLTWLRKQEELIWIKNYKEAEEIIAQSLKVLHPHTKQTTR